MRGTLICDNSLFSSMKLWTLTHSFSIFYFWNTRGAWPPGWFFRQVERRFHRRESNHQPLLSILGTSPLSSSSFGSSWIVDRDIFAHSFSTIMLIKATSHTRLRACNHYTSSTLIGEKAKPVQVRFTLCLKDQWSMWMQEVGCKVYMDSYMASNGSCFTVTWTISKNHLLEASLTQNRETMALQMLTTADLFFFYHVWEPTWIKIRWKNIQLRV